MDTQQRALWMKLQTFEFDLPGTSFTFRDRLARDSGWSRPFADRVVTEYKRFLFLAATAPHPVTPSDEVDQAWHLHLTYTRSYWEDLCRTVLPAPLHHGPTRGGRSERVKFGDWYARTLARYQHAFGEPAPADIWPPPAIRFGRTRHYRRIDSSSVWVIPKPAWASARVRTRALALGAAIVASASCAATGIELPLGLLAGAAALAAVVIASRRQTARRGDNSHSTSGCSTGSSHHGDSESHDGGNDSGVDGGGGDGGGGGGCGGGCGGGD